MKPDLLLCFRIAWRARFASMAMYLCLALVVVSLLAAQFSARQLATVSLDVGLSVIRLGLPLLAVLLVQELLTREFERKLFLTTLTYPRPRHWWLLGRFAGIGLMLLALLAVMALLLAGVVAYMSRSNPALTPVSLGWPYLTTLAFTLVDLLVVMSVATWLSVVARTPSFVLIGSLGFMLIARTYMPIIQLLADDQSLVEKLADPKVYQGSLRVLSYLLPDLGTLDVRMVALYGRIELLPTQWPFVVASALFYVVALLALAVWRLDRRELS